MELGHMYHYIKKNVTELQFQSKILNSGLYKKLYISLRSSAGLTHNQREDSILSEGYTTPYS